MIRLTHDELNFHDASKRAEIQRLGETKHGE
jgi:hypothetical protein